MGGVFFLVGKKWCFCWEQLGNEKYIFCNVDEGEFGIFKDCMLLQYLLGLVIEGMIYVVYVIGVVEGWIYLCVEYCWFLFELEVVVVVYYDWGWLGVQIFVKMFFWFDIYIQLGAGAYVCGEEIVMMNFLEGLRGELCVWIYFLVERGYC